MGTATAPSASPPEQPDHRALLIWLAVGLTVLMTVYWFGPLTAHTVHESNWINGDAFTDDLPDYSYIWGRWRRGDMPLWNPHQLMGVPAAAVLQSGVFYPGNVLYLFLAPPLAFGISNMLHIGLGGWFAGWYAARLGLGRAGIIAAALLACLGSDVFQRFLYHAYMHTSPWIFPCLMALDSLAERPGRRAAAVLALALGMHFMAGWPQATVMAVYVVGLRAVWWFAFNRRAMPAPGRTAGWITLAAGLWVLLISAQFLSTIELLPDSARPLEGYTLEALSQGFHYSWSGWIGDAMSAIPSVRIKRMYLGLIGMFLVFASWTAKDRRREVAFWFGVWLLFALMILGHNGPVYPLYQHLPTGRMFREPSRFMYCAHTAASISVAFGADALWRRFAEMQAPQKRAAVTFLFAALISAAVGVNMYGNQAAWHALGALEPYARVAYPWAAWGAMVLAAVAAYVWRPSRRAAVVMFCIVGGVWIADLFYANRNLHKVVTQVPHYWLSEAELELDLPEGVAGPRVYLRSTWLDFPMAAKWATLTGNAEIGDFEVMHVMRKSRFLRFARDGHPSPPWFFAPGREDIGIDPAYPELLSLLSVQWMALRTSSVIPLAAREWPGELKPPFVDRTSDALRRRGILLAENPDALPRVYVVPHAVVIPEENDTLYALVAEDFDPRTTVILTAPLPPAAPGPDTASATVTARAAFASYAPEDVRVRVESPTPGYLVMTDAWYPGWRATVNGAPAPIARANVLLRAVAIPAGPSEVVFAFRPRLQYVGIAISLVGLVLCAVLLRRPQRGRPAPAPAPGPSDAAH